MAIDDTSPSLSASTTLTNGDSAQPLPSHHSQSHSHAKQKRARSQLSCTPCRQGKLKCNRQQDPACDQCIKRNRESACLFVPPPVKHKQAQNVKGRIRQLESLVVDLMNQNRGALQTRVGEKSGGVDGSATTSEPARAPLPYSQPTPPSDSDTSPQFGTERSRGSADSPDDVDAATGPLGQMTISKNEISYVGESHWGAILNSISDLKRDIGGEEEDDESGHEDEETPPTVNVWGLRNDTLSAAGAAFPRDATQVGFMIGNHTTMTKDQLIAAMPEKKVVDRLLSLWFNSPDPFKPIIHAPTFQDEYRRFWKSPKDTPVMWIALLYAIMSLAASFGLRDLDPRHPQAQTILKEVSQYHTFAASALVLGDFTKPKQHTLECMMLYAAGLRSNNAFVNVWLLIGLVARLAMRMGYHRDASSYPSISVFQGEMRRRIWTIISMIDVMISFQIGLPSIIKTIHSDTQPPRNLLDRDFGPSTQQLPPSRSMDELTPSSYTRAKLRIVRVFADAADLGHSTIPPSTEEVMRLDRELEEAKAAKPPLLQMPEISELVTDPAEQLMCRFNLDLLYLKTKIVLHRRFILTPFHELTAEEQMVGVGTSRKACADAAMRVLQHHQTIYTATQPGGQLESVKWYMGSISTHDFLLAAMVMCLELNEQIKDARSRGPQLAPPNCPKRVAMIEALQKSQRIWSEAAERKKSAAGVGGDETVSKAEPMFDETEKASRAMAVMLERVKVQMGPNVADAPSELSRTGITSPGRGLNPLAPWTSAESGMPAEFWQGAEVSHDWGNVNGVPVDYTLANHQLAMTNTSNSNSGSTPSWNQLRFPFTDPSTGSASASLSPPTLFNNNNSANEPDYAMIGNMLDAPANLDWEMWDNQINHDPQHTHPGTGPGTGSLPQQQLPSAGGLTDDMGDFAAFTELGYGNGNVGGMRGAGPTGTNFLAVDFDWGVEMEMGEDGGGGGMGTGVDEWALL